MKRILRVLFIIGPCLFLFIKNVNAADTLVSSGSTAGQQFYSGYIQTYSDHISDIQNLGYTSVPRSGYYIFNGVNAGVSNVIEYVSPYFAIDITNINVKPDTYYKVVFNILQGGYIQYNASAISSSVKCSLYNGSSWVDNLTDACTTSINGNTFTTYVHTKSSASGIALFFGKTGVVSSNDYLFKNTYSGTQGIRIESYSVYMTNDLSGELGSINNSIDASNKILDEINGKQDQTNQQLDDLNNSINSEDSDVTSKKCGLICKLKGIFTGIIELPSKLVNLLIDALKSLFVPTDDQLYEIVNDSKELTENFGFVGEAVNFFLTIFTSLLGLVNANGCIELPEFSIGATSLFEAHTFWQAQNVCLGDNAILSANIDTIRTITSIALVSLFINFAARKFFSIMSKNDNVVTSDMAASTRGEI